MPARIIADYTNLQNSRRVVYTPDTEGDPYAILRADPRRPQGRIRPGGPGSRARLLHDPRYVLAVDLGQAHDHTAVIGLERLPGRAYRVPFVSRAPLGIEYPTLAQRILSIATSPPFAGCCHLLVDQTGCGRAVVDQLRLGPIPVIGCTVTGGQHVAGGGLNFRIPKRDMIAAAQIAFQDRRLQIAAGADHAAVLLKELAEFKVRISAAGHDSYGVWREGGNDDLAFALALAVWWGDVLAARQGRVALTPTPLAPA